MRKRLGSWNPTRGIWETEIHDLLSEHSEPFSEIWPISGTTRNGVAFQLPPPVLPTDDSESSSSPTLLRTPAAAEAEGGKRNPNREGATMRLSDQVREEQERGLLLPTPVTSDSENSRRHTTTTGVAHPGTTLLDAVLLLPTPVADDSGNSPSEHLRKKPGREIVSSLRVIVEHDLLSTGGRIVPPSNGGSESSDE